MSARRSRRGWLALAAFTAVFALFEAAKHRGWTVPAAFAGAVLPFAAAPFAALAPPVAAALRHPVTPLCLLAAVMFVPQPQTSAVAMFTGGLAWLSHVAARRGRPRPVPDPRPRPRPSARPRSLPSRTRENR